MSSNGPPDAWDALRDRLDRRSARSRRAGWVPGGSRRDARREPASPDERDDSETPARSPRLDRAHVVVAALVTAVALMGTVVVLGNAQPAQQVVPVATPQPTAPAGTTADATATVEVAPSSEPQQMRGQPASSTSRLMVHVVGDVADPGVVRLDPGSRVIDAVQAAGGALPEADLSTVNLARLVADGEQVRVGLPPDDAVAGVVSDAGQSAGVVNVNQAGVDRLVELPGIGPVLAGRIVTYRDTNGPFVSVDQLLEVPGIGPSILESIHERIQL